MFYIFVVDDSGKVLSEVEEDDYETFIIRCYNFRQHSDLKNLHVFHIKGNGKRYQVSTESIEEMIETWLDPEALFAMGYPLAY